MIKINDLKCRQAFDSYPTEIGQKVLFLRQLVFEAAEAAQDVGHVTETTKWGQPSYVAKKGSTVRLGWSEKQPDFYAVYFICSTNLVETFRELYKDTFNYEGNRAIIFHKDDVVPVEALKNCLTLALTYHQVKHLPLLGA